MRLLHPAVNEGDGLEAQRRRGKWTSECVHPIAIHGGETERQRWWALPHWWLPRGKRASFSWSRLSRLSIPWHSTGFNLAPSAGRARAGGTGAALSALVTKRPKLTASPPGPITASPITHHGITVRYHPSPGTSRDLACECGSTLPTSKACRCGPYIPCGARRLSSNNRPSEEYLYGIAHNHTTATTTSSSSSTTITTTITTTSTTATTTATAAQSFSRARERWKPWDDRLLVIRLVMRRGERQCNFTHSLPRYISMNHP